MAAVDTAAASSLASAIVQFDASLDPGTTTTGGPLTNLPTLTFASECTEVLPDGKQVLHEKTGTGSCTYNTATPTATATSSPTLDSEWLYYGWFEECDNSAGGSCNDVWQVFDLGQNGPDDPDTATLPCTADALASEGSDSTLPNPVDMVYPVTLGPVVTTAGRQNCTLTVQNETDVGHVSCDDGSFECFRQDGEQIQTCGTEFDLHTKEWVPWRGCSLDSGST